MRPPAVGAARRFRCKPQLPGVGRDDYGQPEYANDGHALEWTYRAAAQSDEYEVELVVADYETGDVTMHVAEENR